MKKLNVLTCLLFLFLTCSNAQVQIGKDIAGGNGVVRNIALSDNGHVLAIGTKGNGSNGQISTYERIGNSWEPMGENIEGQNSGYFIGDPLALSENGQRMVIGVTQSLPSGLLGRVQVFEFINGAWTQMGTDINGENDYFFGWDVGISNDGNRIIVGSPRNSDVFPDTLVGFCRIYEFDGIDWVALGSDLLGTQQSFFGNSVSMSGDGNRVGIGALSSNGGAGMVSVFEFTGGDWTLLGEEIPGQSSSQLGISVSLSDDGSRIAVGGRGDEINNQSPFVLVLEYSDGNWWLLGWALQGELDTRFGRSVSLSGDGNLLAVGAPGDGNIPEYYGETFLYQYSNEVWSQAGEIITGDTELDLSGHNVALSADGSTLALSARGANDFFGRVRVYGDLVLSDDNYFDLSETNIHLYPNPFSKLVTFKIKNDNFSKLTFDLFNALGQRLKMEQFDGNQLELFRNDLPSGTYFYTIKNGHDLLSSGKLIAR